MGFLDVFKKNQSTKEKETTNLGLEEDPFKSDPFMDPNSGLNLPQEETQTNPYLNNTHNQQTTQNPRQNPFEKYQQQETNYAQNNYQQPNNDVQKDLQIIIAKLDALRAEMQSLNHRIENIERTQNKRTW